MNSPRLAVVGCGAIARSFHLPALARHAGIRRELVLVHRLAACTQALSVEFDVAANASNHRDLLDSVDGAIIAVPPELHASIASDFLDAGVPVLCEKPLATSGSEARALVELAARMGTVLAVNNNRRAYPGAQQVRR
jgi:predicted dehydrogenase